MLACTQVCNKDVVAMRGAILLTGILSFVSAFLGGVLASTSAILWRAGQMQGERLATF
jgi:hypothetical protein